MRPAPALLAAAAAAAVAGRHAAGAGIVAYSLRYAADPAPIVGPDGRLYISTSHDHANATSWGDLVDYGMLSTADMVNFADEGLIFDARNATWGPRGAWAQQILAVGPGQGAPPGYYLYWPNIGGNWSQRSGVGVAFSTTVAGPYADITPRLHLPHGIMPGEDPTVARDPDTGRVYVCSAPGGADGTFLCGELNTTTMGTWVQAPRLVGGFAGRFEAPWLHKVGGAWRMSYMCPPGGGTFRPGPQGGHYGYDICQAVCEDGGGGGGGAPACPLRNFTPVDAPLLWNPPFDCESPAPAAAGGSGGGVVAPVDCTGAPGSNSHHGVVSYRGRWFAAYHTRLLPALRGVRPSTKYVRGVGVDAAYVNATTGAFAPVTVTPGWTRQLAWVDAYAAPLPGTLMAEGTDGLASAPAGNATAAGARWVLSYPPGVVSWTRVAGVDLGPPSPGGLPQTVQLTLCASAPGARLHFVVDTLGSPAVAQLVIPATAAAPSDGPAGACGWATLGARVQVGALSGVHDIILGMDATALPPNATLALGAWQLVNGAVSAGSAPPPVVVPCAGLTSKATGGFLAVGSLTDPTAPVTAGAPPAGGAAVPSPATALTLEDNEDGTYAVRALGVALPAREAQEAWDSGNAPGVPAGWPPPRRLTASPYTAGNESEWVAQAGALAGAAAGGGALVAYLCAPPGGGPVAPTATAPTDDCARWSLQGTTDGSYVLVAAASGLAAAVDPATGRVAATAPDPRAAPHDGARWWLTCGAPVQPT